MVDGRKVPEGYKVTGAGIIPENWDANLLGDIILVYRGGSPRPIQDYLTTSNSGINWIKIGDVGIGAKYIEKTEEKIIPEGITRSRYVQPGDLLLSNSMSFGRPYILRTDGCIHDGWLVLKNFEEMFESNFLYYLLSSDVVLQQYKSKAAGSGVLNLNKDLVNSVNLVVPPITEQKAIAEALSDTDNLILSLEKLIDKKKKIKQGAMQHLLTGKKRLPGFSGDWENDKVKNIASVSTGSKNTQDNDPNGKYPFFVRSSIVERIDTYSFDGEAVLTAGDGVGTGKVFHYINGKFDIHQRVYKISDFCSRVHGYYFYLYFSFNFLDRIMAMTAKSSVDSVRMEMIADMEILLPEIQEQKAIAQVLSDMDAEIEVLEEKLEKYKTIKQGMMQELLTGRIRLI